MTVLTAASGSQLASWDETAKHGLFTHHLLDALYGKADRDGDGTVTAREAKRYLDRHMTRAARRTLKRNQIASLNGAADTALSAAVGRAFPKRPTTLASLPEAAPPVTPAPAAPPVVAAPDGSSVEKALGISRSNRILIQRGLNALKLDAGPADGLFGPKTREAIRQWQGSKGLGATGYLTRDHASALIAMGREVKVAVGVYPGAPPVIPAPARPARRPGTKVAVGVYPSAPPVTSAPALSARKPGTVFRDCATCPEMVVIPGGSFLMGDFSGDGRNAEKPVHRVTIPRAFAVGKLAVTFEEWDSCVSAGGCSHQAGDARGRRPVVGVSWNEAQVYIKWLSGKTGKTYRLLSEAEWEYVARAGSDMNYPAGSETGFGKANRFGIYDTVGTVREWVGDCWNESYAGAPSDGSAWRSGDCSRRVLRRGRGPRLSADVDTVFRTQSYILSNWSTGGSGVIEEFGFRLARTLKTTLNE